MKAKRGAGDTRLMTSAGVLMGASLLQSDAGVDHGVEDVHHHVDDDDHGAAHQNDPLNHWKVAEVNALEQQPADAGPGEDDLNHDRDIDHDDEVDPGQGQH